ncbi:disintegrin and metalloproteinase domain-containing protein 21-like [Pelodiscus sinensis]|uniref:disintegrin and metalloproteinase domain-containing protein 21-like n=1 Tax=Pelodiscus sinensis TaxID=13735 RepID=UPI003F6C3C77
MAAVGPLWAGLSLLLGSLLPSAGRGGAAALPRYQVTVPRRLAPAGGREAEGQVSFQLQLGGRRLVAQLWRKDLLLASHLPVFTYERGGLVRSQPFIPAHCYYEGYVEGAPGSLVVLSTCSGGLRGLLRIEGTSYGIEPVKASSTFQHLLYQMREVEGRPASCGVTAEELQHLETKTQDMAPTRVAGRRKWTHATYIEFCVVVEKEQFILHRRNESYLTSQVLEVINMVDSFYRAMGAHVVLVGLEIWTENNLITLPNDIGNALTEFNQWRTDVLYRRLQHDAGQLFMAKTYRGRAGRAYVGGICLVTDAASVVTWRFASVPFFSVTVAHELGHNLGMYHDYAKCHCKRTVGCIMAAVHVTTDEFSDCSHEVYYNLLRDGAGFCLYNIPAPSKNFMMQHCGNKVVERKEECDCGSELECKKDPCCQSTCKLKPHAVCAFGKCCKKCQILAKGKLCRAAVDECDLPEYCNGTSELCQDDVHVQDGTPCRDMGYCYHGRCRNHNKQCADIFGRGAQKAPLSCFSNLNTRGDRFGNCGGETGANYKRCKTNDVLCGRIQCKNVKKLPSLKEHSTVVQTPIGDIWCWGTDHHAGIDVVDTGAVKDGTFCGNGKICLNRTCASVSNLNFDCDAKKKCNSRGVCTSTKNCHCKYGWAPPDCKLPGYGGSIDSGPAPMSKPMINIRSRSPGNIIWIVIGISIVIVPSIVAVLIKIGWMKLFGRLDATQRKQTAAVSDNDRQSLQTKGSIKSKK